MPASEQASCEMPSIRQPSPTKTQVRWSTIAWPGPVELRGEQPLGERHADRVGEALAERTGRGLDAGRDADLRVAGRLRVQLAEALAARRAAGRSRSGAAARTAASSRGRWTARSGRDRPSADCAGLCDRWRCHSATAISAMPIGMPGWPDFAASTASIASARIALARSESVARRGGHGRCVGRWDRPARRDGAQADAPRRCRRTGCAGGPCRTAKSCHCAGRSLKLSRRAQNCAIIQCFRAASPQGAVTFCRTAARWCRCAELVRNMATLEGTTDGRHPSVGRMVRLPRRHARVHARRRAARSVCIDAVAAAGLTVVGERFHQFEPQGVTGTVLLAESHLAIHTWPEHGFVTDRRLRLQLHDRQHRQGRAAVPRARGGAEADAHACSTRSTAAARMTDDAAATRCRRPATSRPAC